MDGSGNRLCGCNQASSLPVLKYRLHKENIICLQVKKQNHLLTGIKRWGNRKKSLFFLSQLAALLNTGINMNKAIVILKGYQNDKLLSWLFKDIHRQLNSGSSLSDTLRNYPVLFDDVTLHIIQSGEFAGQIDKAILQAGEYLEQKSQTSGDLLTALLYPAMLGMVTLGVLGIMLFFIIPQFDTLYSGSGNKLPFITTVVLSLSEWIREHLFLLFSSLPMALLLYKIVSTQTRIELARLIPRLNRAMIQANTLRLCQTLDNLYRCGVSVTDALMLCKNLSKSHRYRLAVTQTVDKIHQGVELGQALQETGYFEPIFIQLIRTGEQSADLSHMLKQGVHYYKKQLGNSLSRLKILLEPLLIVTLGIIIGIILIAMYLPVFNMGTSF